MNTKMQKGILKTAKLYLEFRTRASQALAKYGVESYDTNDKDVCLAIMDQQILDLKKINADWVQLAQSERGYSRGLDPKQFYNDFLKPAIEHRNNLAHEIVLENSVKITLTPFQRLVQFIKNQFNASKKEED
jgi:hypothetical protein